MAPTLSTLVVCATLISGCAALTASPVASLPPGFRIEVFSSAPQVRRLVVVDGGSRVVVSTSDGRLLAIDDADRDGRAERRSEVVRGLRMPDGLAALENGDLVIAEQHRLVRIRPDARAEIVVPEGVLPPREPGTSRALRVGPDHRLYLGIAAPRGRRAPRGFEAQILRLGPDGEGLELFADGVETAAGLAFETASGVLFFTDGGTDGTDPSLAELNRAPRARLVFSAEARGPVVPPVLLFESGIEPAALHFYQGTMFPAAYQGDGFVAARDAEGRAQVLRVRFDGGRPAGTEPFLVGWRAGRGGVRTPVDLGTLPDGSLLLTDEEAGVIWRISYRGP